MLRIPHDRLSASQIAETENEWLPDRIVHGGAFAMGSYQTGLAEDAEVLGGVVPLAQADGIGPLCRSEVELLFEGIDPGHDDFEFVAGFEGFLFLPTDEALPRLVEGVEIVAEG